MCLPRGAGTNAGQDKQMAANTLDTRLQWQTTPSFHDVGAEPVFIEAHGVIEFSVFFMILT